MADYILARSNLLWQGIWRGQELVARETDPLLQFRWAAMSGDMIRERARILYIYISIG